MVRGRSTFLAAAFMALLCFAPSALAAGGFSDVPPGFWARQQIKWAANNGWITPSSPTAFKPHHSVSRLNASRVLVRIAFQVEGVPEGPDPFAQAVAAANQLPGPLQLWMSWWNRSGYDNRPGPGQMGAVVARKDLDSERLQVGGTAGIDITPAHYDAPAAGYESQSTHAGAANSHEVHSTLIRGAEQWHDRRANVRWCWKF